MNKFKFSFILLLSIIFLPQIIIAGVSVIDSVRFTDTLWINAENFGIRGTGWDDNQSMYDRLPVRAETLVTKKVWNLSHNSAGINFKFKTNAGSFKIKWTLNGQMLQMPHMPANGVSGIDVYYRQKNGGWFYLGTGRASILGQNSASFSSPDTMNRPIEYMVYLPLYNGINKMEVGVLNKYELDPISDKIEKPIVFYGTSITQGGCASRPGLVYTSIISRELDCEVINLGFSGSAQMELPLAGLLNELDCKVLFIDPLRNMTMELVKERAERFIRKLLEVKPNRKIVIVEDSDFRNGKQSERGIYFENIYNKLIKEGVRNIYFLKGKDRLGSDGESTVDGVHPNDIGFMREAESHLKFLRNVLKVR